MAYEEMKVLKEIELGRDLLRISSGKTAVDIRRYYKNEKGEWAPGNKGIRLPKELLLDVIKPLVEEMEENEVFDLLEEIGLDRGYDEETEESETEDLQGFDEVPEC